MRELLCILITLMLALFFVMLTNIAKKCNELESEIQVTQETLIYENEELKKEIRLLKTDIQILEEGTRK